MEGLSKEDIISVLSEDQKRELRRLGREKKKEQNEKKPREESNGWETLFVSGYFATFQALIIVFGVITVIALITECITQK